MVQVEQDGLQTTDVLPVGRDIFVANLQSVLDQRASLGIVSLVGLVFIATILVDAIERSLDRHLAAADAYRSAGVLHDVEGWTVQQIADADIGFLLLEILGPDQGGPIRRRELSEAPDLQKDIEHRQPGAVGNPAGP
jgi:hypothetical protein